MIKFVKETLDEDVMGGVSSPGATLNNVPGQGNATPGTVSQNTDGNSGSGDAWNNEEKPTKKKKKKTPKGPFEKPATQAVAESNMNPYDKREIVREYIK